MKRQCGFTLIEILIVMGIATVAGLLLLVVIVNSAGLFTKESAKVTQGLNINDTLSKVRTTIKDARAVAGSYTDGPVTYTTGINQLVLRVPSIDSLGNIMEGTDDYFVFFLDNTKLHLRTFPNPASFRQGSDRIFTTAADSLNFYYFNSSEPKTEEITRGTEYCSRGDI